jgi:hypothetical protein
MKIQLQITKENFDLIASGTKTIDYRAASTFNKKKLLRKAKNGKWGKHFDIKEIEFINGFSPDAPRLIIECIQICPIFFINDFVNEENNITAPKGGSAIEILLGKIIS